MMTRLRLSFLVLTLLTAAAPAVGQAAGPSGAMLVTQPQGTGGAERPSTEQTPTPTPTQPPAPTGDPGVDAAAEPARDAAPVAVTDQTLEQFRWTDRLVVVFADSPRDPAFARQIDLLTQRPQALADREVRVLTDTDPAANSAVRRSLRPRGFAVVIVDKDGSVVQRKPSPWDVREITRAIDKTPIRQQELRDAREAERSLLGLPPE